MEQPSQGFLRRLHQVRRRTLALTEPLSIEDQRAQTMALVSPTWWHLAHTTWFFEALVLARHLPAYQPFDPGFDGLLNSYYQRLGPQLPREQRGTLSRPTLARVLSYREHVDQALDELMQQDLPETELPGLLMALEIALHHEQQHQELILTDIKHVLASNPLRPAYRPGCAEIEKDTPQRPNSPRWINFDGGLFEIGSKGDRFSFDNEGPRHPVFLQDFALASDLVTCGEFIEFIDDGGYHQPLLWLDLGWQWLQNEGWRAPLYWERRQDQWWLMTLGGLRPVDPDEPLCHISYFEADAFARWAGHRLPTEAEWEVAAKDRPIEGNFAEAERFHPGPLPPNTSPDRTEGPNDLFGQVWEWTASAYLPYPGFQPWPGAFGEYNGKFMCNQFVLRGGSCASPADHLRPTYRNYFSPHSRWQFSGFRLAS